MSIGPWTLMQAFSGIGPLALFITIAIGVYLTYAFIWTEEQI